MNDLIRPALYQAHHEIWPVIASDRPSRVVDLVGLGLQVEAIFLPRTVSFRNCESGELVVLLDAGAFWMSLSSHYNTRVHPAEVLVEGGKARLVRRRETLDDLMASEVTVAV